MHGFKSRLGVKNTRDMKNDVKMHLFLLSSHKVALFNRLLAGSWLSVTKIERKRT